ncbi:cytochrome c [Sulfuriferula plumbiphila]|uniref:Cytochrome c n=2 Tax=Sulfuriferula plumbiphila TaxID=171865 RepID=A0A512L6D3_9PROT|nr:cytochrome c [Sulfuriferula plumbiphila]GEP30027.1 cytochrome c [Sulfuriferula plumbiphila]
MSAQAGLSHADAQAGATIAKNGTGSVAACMQCHGANGEGQAAAGFPRLAGQNRDYLAKQLADFKAKLRTNPLMQPIASALSTAQMNDVADYYASLPAWKPGPGIASSTAQTTRGAQLAHQGNWDKGMPACFACHGENGAGIAPHFPGIAGQNATYIASQLKDWQTGARLNDPQGLMKAVADKLSAADISAVSAYLENPK